MTDEILVKGTDGKWYLLQGEELVPYDPAQKPSLGAGKSGIAKNDLPKGVTKESYKKVTEKPAVKAPPVISVPAPTPRLLPAHTVSVDHDAHPLSKELDELIDATVADIHLTFDQIHLRKRFRALISSRLRGVRDVLETKAILARDMKVGGLGVVEAQADRAMARIERSYAEFEKKWKKVEMERIEIWKQKQKGKIMGEKPAAPPPIARSPVSPISNQPISKSTNFSISPAPLRPSPIPKLDSKPNRPITSSSIIPPQPALPVSRPSLTKRVTDVRPPRLLGPLEELKEMKLVDFHRLGKTAAEATARIKSKIDLLKEDSFSKGIAGINAWKESEIHRLYLSLNGEALREGKSIEEVLSVRTSSAQPVLTTEEVHAIMELNKTLRL